MFRVRHIGHCHFSEGNLWSSCRRHLKEIPPSSSNVFTSFTWAWDPTKTSELLSGMGVSVLKKEHLGSENTPQDLLISLSPPQKRQKVKEKDKDFVIARRPRLLREPESGRVTPAAASLSLWQWLWVRYFRSHILWFRPPDFGCWIQCILDFSKEVGFWKQGFGIIEAVKFKTAVKKK